MMFQPLIEPKTTNYNKTFEKYHHMNIESIMLCFLICKFLGAGVIEGLEELTCSLHPSRHSQRIKDMWYHRYTQKKHTCVIIRMCNVGIGVPMATVLYPVRRYFHIKYPGCKEQCYLVC